MQGPPHAGGASVSPRPRHLGDRALCILEEVTTSASPRKSSSSHSVGAPGSPQHREDPPHTGNPQNTALCLRGCCYLETALPDSHASVGGLARR